MARDPGQVRIEELTAAVARARAELEATREALEEQRQRVARAADLCHTVALRAELIRRQAGEPAAPETERPA